MKVLSQHEIGAGVFAERIGSHKWRLFNWTRGQLTSRTWPTMRQAKDSYYLDNWNSLGWYNIDTYDTRGAMQDIESDAIEAHLDYYEWMDEA